MGIYLGSNKYKLNIGSSAFVLAVKNLINGIALHTANNQILTDSNGLYLTVKESE